MINLLFLAGALIFAGVVLFIGHRENKKKGYNMPFDEAFVKACSVRCRCAHVTEEDIKQAEADFKEEIESFKLRMTDYSKYLPHVEETRINIYEVGYREPVDFTVTKKLKWHYKNGD